MLLFEPLSALKNHLAFHLMVLVVSKIIEPPKKHLPQYLVKLFLILNWGLNHDIPLLSKEQNLLTQKVRIS